MRRLRFEAMKTSALRNILLVFTLAANVALAAQMDIFAEAPVVKRKPKAAQTAPKADVKKDAAVPGPQVVMGPQPTPTQWVQTMHASMGPLSPESVLTGPTASQTFLLWLGWAMAGVFGGVLVAQSLRGKRRQQDLLRAGQRDTFFLPPSKRRF
jgi:hypothetical protein